MLTPTRSRYTLDQLVAGIELEDRDVDTDWSEPAGAEAW